MFLCPDRMETVDVMTTIASALIGRVFLHVVMLADIVFICTRLYLLVFLQLDITGDPVFFQIQEVLFVAVSVVRRFPFQYVKALPRLRSASSFSGASASLTASSF